MTKELEEQINNLQRMVEDECSRRCILETKLEIATKALKDALRDYEINGPCEEDCVGYYMYFIIRRALKELEEV